MLLQCSYERFLGHIWKECFVSWRPWLWSVLFFSFHFYFRDIARFCREKKALVLTGDSDFLVFELEGIVLIDGIKSLFHPRVYYQERILQHFNISREQLYYFVTLRGNDFIGASNNVLKKDENTKMSPSETLEYVKQHFTQAVTTTKKYQKVKEYYENRQVEYPWNSLTLDKSKATTIKQRVKQGSTARSLLRNRNLGGYFYDYTVLLSI